MDPFFFRLLLTKGQLNVHKAGRLVRPRPFHSAETLILKGKAYPT